MLNKLKIYTAISLIIGSFAVMLLGITSFSVFNSVANNSNFKRILVTSENNNEVRDAAYNISASLANISGMMLQVAEGRTASAERTEATQNLLKKAQGNINAFMASPFNSPEESKAADDVKRAFDALFILVNEKMSYLQRPADYTGSLGKEMELRALLRGHIDRYNALTSGLSEGYIEEAETDYRNMIVAGGVVVSIALIMLFAIRFWLRNTLVRRMAMTTDVLKKVAEGDLSQPVAVGNENEIGLMLKEMEQMRLSLTGTILGIRQSVTHIHTSAQEIAHGNSDLSSRTEEQAAALQETAASMEQIKTTVRQNADNAHAARQLAESASNNAQHGGEAMENLEQIMVQITDSSRQIADINSVIDSIANQTNILALNAAVEAARAGEQGRGFAVVAEEVRNLAKRSADAAKEINQLINTCVNNMDTGSRQVNQASGVMQDIVTSVDQVRQIMGEITSASDEQSAGINQISQAVNEMDLVTQQNAAMVEEAAMAAGELEAQSDSLEKLVAQFVLSPEGSTKKAQPLVETVSRPRAARADDENAQWETF